MRYASLRYAALLLAFAASTFAAHADTYTYTYTGSDFTTYESPYTGTSFLSGSFTLASPLLANSTQSTIAASSYSFTDGINTYTNLNSTVFDFAISTDGSGDISGWEISADGVGFIISSNFGDQAQDNGALALNVTGGTWTETTTPSAVPEPSTFALLGTGLLGLADVARRRFLHS